MKSLLPERKDAHKSSPRTFKRRYKAFQRDLGQSKKSTPNSISTPLSQLNIFTGSANSSDKTSSIATLEHTASVLSLKSSFEKVSPRSLGSIKAEFPSMEELSRLRKSDAERLLDIAYEATLSVPQTGLVFLLDGSRELDQPLPFEPLDWFALVKRLRAYLNHRPSGWKTPRYLSLCLFIATTGLTVSKIHLIRYRDYHPIEVFVRDNLCPYDIEGPKELLRIAHDIHPALRQERFQERDEVIWGYSSRQIQRIVKDVVGYNYTPRDLARLRENWPGDDTEPGDLLLKELRQLVLRTAMGMVRPEDRHKTIMRLPTIAEDGAKAFMKRIPPSPYAKKVVRKKRR